MAKSKTTRLAILGAQIDDLSLKEVMVKIEQHLQSSHKAYIVTPNPEICLLSYQNKHFRRIIQNSFISLPDGFGLKVVAPLWGSRLNNTTTGIDLTYKLLELAEQKKYSVLFFEGQPVIGGRAIEVIKKLHPQLTINYLDPGQVDKHGQFSNPQLIAEINQLHPDIILVNLGAPKQELFIHNNLPKLQTKLMLGIGGSLDFIAGRITRAPQSWRSLGLEWLWRFKQEPQRWPRIFKAVIIFPLICLRWRFGNLFIYRKNVAGFIINKQKQILITLKTNDEYWQIPQGGAKNAKTKTQYEEAILREMSEELGTNKFKVLARVKNCYKYKWPKQGRNLDFDKYKGQKQTLFLLEFSGQDSDIKLDNQEHSDWQWITKENILAKMPVYKKPLISIALNKFKNYL